VALRAALTGLTCTVIIAIALVAVQLLTPHSISWIFDNILHLAVASVVLSGVLSVAMYLSSLKKGAVLADGGNTGTPRRCASRGPVSWHTRVPL
jgi:hypothetical protein